MTARPPKGRPGAPREGGAGAAPEPEAAAPRASGGDAVRVLVVEDHPIVRRGIRDLLEAEAGWRVIGETDNAADALRLIQLQVPSVAIIDISIKGRDGLELTKAIRAQELAMPILIMSMHDEELYAERVLRAGANGYIMKQEVAEKVVAALRQVLAGEVYLSDAAHRRLLRGLGRQGSRDDSGSPYGKLTDRELEVFRLIGEGNTTRQIAGRLHLSIKTIETYRAHLKEKLGLRTGSELVRDAVHWAEREGAERRPPGE